jgi:hypothetical protein
VTIDEVWIGKFLRTHCGGLCHYWSAQFPLTVLHILQECQRYDDKCQAFHHHGALSDVLENDSMIVSNVVVFLFGIFFIENIV